MALLTTPQQTSSLQLVGSQYGPGGALYVNPLATPTNSTATNSTLPSPYTAYNQQAPVGNQQGQSATNGIMSPDLLKSAGKFTTNGFSSPSLTAATNTVNAFGTNLGFSAGNTAAISTGGATESISPALAAADPSLLNGAGAVQGGLSSATLSGTLGAAGLGALAGNFLGRIGGNSTSGSIGGGIGAAIGNMILPGVGGIVGGLIGGIGGGFFGNHSTPTNAASHYGQIDPNTGTIVNVQSGGSKNPGDFANFGSDTLKSLSVLTSNAAKDLGIKFNPNSNVTAGISTQHGGASIEVGGTPTSGDMVRFGQEHYDYTNPDSVKEAQYTALKHLAEQAGYKDTAKLDAWYKNFSDTYGKTGSGSAASVNIPLSTTQFADYMTKFKTQGSPNASA